MNTLIYHSEEKEVKPLCKVLEQCNILVDICTSEERCLDLAATELYAALLVVQDYSFEELQKFYLEWKSRSYESLFIVLTGRQSALDRARALGLGVDYYWIEPYSYSQLLIEINRYEFRRDLKHNNQFTTPNFEVDLLARAIFCQGKLLDLTRTEFDLLSIFIRKRGTVLSRLQIWEELRGYQDYPLANTVDVHVNRLRKKLPIKKEIIKTIHGIGYLLDE